MKPRNREYVEEDRTGTLNRERFSLRDEARNTERNHGWNSDQKLRNSQINFVSDGSSSLEKLIVSQGSAQAALHERNASLSLPKISLASMTIQDQDLCSADSQILDQTPDKNASIISTVTGNLDRGQVQGGPTNGVTFTDRAGSYTSLNSPSTLPKTPCSLSPSRSDTSEELIVFSGRKSAHQQSLQNHQLSSCRSSHSKDQKHPVLIEESHQNNLVAPQSPISVLATLHEPYHLTEPADIYWESSLLERPANNDHTENVKVSRKRRRKQRQSKSKARLHAEEDDILADYIEHMHSEEDIGEAFRDKAQDGILRRDPSTGNTLEVKFDGDTEEIVAAQSSPGSPFKDLRISHGCHGSDLDPSAVSKYSHSVNDAQAAADLQEYTDDKEDESDLLERRRAVMTDQQIARLLAKQEEFGLSSSELLLFDGSEVRDDEGLLRSEDEEDAVFLSFSAASNVSRRAKRSQQYQAFGASRSSVFAADIPNQHPYGDFDVMDHARQSLKRIPRGRRGAAPFELSDAELDAHLLLAWEKDRSKKKIRKKEREELRAQGLLAGSSQIDLKAKYREGLSFSQIQMELKEFIASTRQSLALPPMANKERRIVHEMAHALRLKSKSSGVGKARFPVLFKTGRTDERDLAAVSNLEAVLNPQRFFPRKDVKGPKKLESTRYGRRNAGKTAGVSYQDGEVVGAAAPEIGVENRGRAMLEKMGWSKGTALGALNNKGMLQPVIHTVKTTKAGLG